MDRYRFLRTKRYPHPDGPKRRAGTEYPVDDATAALWVPRGIITPVAAAREDTMPPAPGGNPTTAPARVSKPKAKARDSRRVARSTSGKE